jgi:hypothetical protein
LNCPLCEWPPFLLRAQNPTRCLSNRSAAEPFQVKYGASRTVPPDPIRPATWHASTVRRPRCPGVRTVARRTPRSTDYRAVLARTQNDRSALRRCIRPSLDATKAVVAIGRETKRSIEIPDSKGMR